MIATTFMTCVTHGTQQVCQLTGFPSFVFYNTWIMCFLIYFSVIVFRHRR